MARHALSEPATDLEPAEIARVLCGAHAQVLSAAELSVGRRLAGATRADVRRALWAERSLIKTFGPRGTIHLLATVDLPMWTGVRSALRSRSSGHPEGVRFTPEQTEKIIVAIGEALADRELTIDELTDAIADRVGMWAVERTMEAFQDKWPRWRQLTSAAAHRGVLCFGPDRGHKVTYTNPHRWLPGFSPAGTQASVRALLRRYLYAYGPATPQQFARWLGVAPRYAVGLFDELGDAVERVLLDSEPSWTLAGDARPMSARHRGVRLLPYFDAYIVAGQPREWLFPGPAAVVR